MGEYRIGQNVSDRLIKVIVNKYDDVIVLDANDTRIVERYSKFINWTNAREKELAKEQAKFEKKYANKDIIVETDDGITVDAVQIEDMARIQVEFYTEAIEKLDEIFGEGTIHKYFREIYEEIPDFLPDDECIFDFLNELTPVMEEIFKQRFDRLQSKYNKGRKGKHSLSRQELIDKYKEEKK